MLRYTISRLLHLIPVLFILSVLAFSMVRFLPGDVLDVLAGEEDIDDPEIRAAFIKEYGLDKPIYVQYLKWVGKVLRGDFGDSMVTRRPIAIELFERIPATVYLALVAIVISLLIAVPLGTIAAVRRNTPTDYVAQTTSLFGISIPEFWFAIMAILLFSLYLGWLPSSEYYSPFEDFGKSLRHLILPAATIGFRQAAVTTRLTRSSMLDEVRRDYVDTARSLGLSERKVIYKYTLRNAMIPTLTITGLQMAQLLGGTIIIEQIFAWPGIGYAIYSAVVSRDYPLLQAGVLVLGTIVVLTNLAVDLMYRLLNPRIRLA
ncbi:Glutathione transport system permease protein GsiC [Candidatus Entotheonellaceae bacterium PAL068K]